MQLGGGSYSAHYLHIWHIGNIKTGGVHFLKGGFISERDLHILYIGHILHIMHILHIRHICHMSYILHIFYILRLKKSNATQGHICLYSTLLIEHTKHQGVMSISSWPFVPQKLQQSNPQDYVFIRPSGISEGAFQLRIDNIWFCKLLLLFSIDTIWPTREWRRTNMDMFQCWRNTKVAGDQVIFCIFCILCIYYIVHILHMFVILFDRCAAWLDACQSTIVYERSESAQVLYVIPVSSILGRLPIVPVGNTGTIPYEMRREAADFPGASSDKTKDGKDGCRWWYVNSWALSWGTKQWWNEYSPRDL